KKVAVGGVGGAGSCGGSPALSSNSYKKTNATFGGFGSSRGNVGSKSKGVGSKSKGSAGGSGDVFMFSVYPELGQKVPLFIFTLRNTKNKTGRDSQEALGPLVEVAVEDARIHGPYCSNYHHLNTQYMLLLLFTTYVISELRLRATKDPFQAVDSSFLLDDDTSIPFSVDDLSKSMDLINVEDIEPPPLMRDNSGFSFLLLQMNHDHLYFSFPLWLLLSGIIGRMLLFKKDKRHMWKEQYTMIAQFALPNKHNRNTRLILKRISERGMKILLELNTTTII
ncbi:hypothetical protein Tco_0237867, partial [Tanacetum coccineum]